MGNKTPLTWVMSRRCRKAATLFVFGVFVFLGAFAASDNKAAEAATASTMNFQARLQTAAGAITPDGTYNVEFKLYNIDTGGTTLWTEDYLNSAGQGVTVRNGYLTVNLGSVTSFPNTINWDQDLWLTMTVRGTGSCAFAACTPADAEMSPRLKLTAIPYAFKAGQLAQFNQATGFTSTLSLTAPTGGNQNFTIPDQGAAGNYTLLTTQAANGSYIQNGTSPQTADFNVTGNGTLGGSLTAGGNVLFKNAVNSAAALQVQNANGANVFSVDTTTINVVTNPGAEVDTSGWTTLTGGTLTRNTTLANTNAGVASFQLVTTATANAGMRATNFTSTPNFATSATWNFSFYAKLLSGTMTTLQAGYNNGADTNCTLNNTTLSTTGFNRYSCTITLTSGQSINSLYIRQTDATARTLYVDSVQLTAGSSLLPYDIGNISLRGVVNTPAAFQSNSNSTTAFQVQNAAGTGNNLVVDTLNSIVYLNNSVRVANGSYGAALNVAGTTITRTNNAAAFQVQNNNATPIFGVNTVAAASNLITNPGFEANTTGWANKTGGTLTRITTPATALYYGIASGQIALTTANGGASYAIAQTLGAAYNLSFYARTSTGTANNISMGYTNSGGDVDCATNMTVVAGGFTRYTCSYTVTGTAGTAVYIKQSSAVTQTLYIDAFQLLVSSTSATPYNLGTIQLRGVIDAPAAFQNANDSTTSFQIQNSAGTSNLFVADTLNGRVGIGTNAAAYKLDVAGDINSSTGFRVGGAAGAAVSCSGGQLLQNAVVAGGIVTGGSCVAATTGGVTTVGTIDSQTKNANGAVIVGTTIYMQSADASNAGLVTNTAQTFGGNKTFAGNIFVGASATNQQVQILGGATNHGLEIGRTDGTASTPFTDYHSSGNANDYDARIIASGGTATLGQGTLTFQAQNTNVSGNLQTGGTTRIDNAGNISGASLNINGNATVTGQLNVSNFNSIIAANGANTVLGAVTNSIAQSPMGTLWHDLLAFNKKATPTYERYNGTWASGALDNGLFAQQESRAATYSDGTTYTRARWTWNNMAWSQGEWFNIGFTYSGTGQNNNVLVESSADGSTWTTRHTSTGNTFNAQTAWFYVQAYGGDPYVRLTITSTGGLPTNLSSIRLLTARWGDQGMGSELSYPYSWDGAQNMAIGAGSVVANGTLTIGTNTTTSAGGLYFGTDTNLYRSGTNALKTDDDFVAAGNVAGATMNAVSGFKYNGTSGMSTTCSGGQLIQNAVVQGGILTGGSCVAAVAGGVTTVGTFSNATSYANGASISGNTITFGAANASNPGMVSTGSQTFAGDKTIAANISDFALKADNNSTTGYGIYGFANNNNNTNDVLRLDGSGGTVLSVKSNGNVTSAGTLTLNNASGQTIAMGTAASINTNATGDTTTIANYATSGYIIMQSGAFAVQDTVGYNNSLYISNTGQTTFKNRVNNAYAFQVQDSTGNTAFVVDTVNQRLGVGLPTPGYKLDVAGDANLSTGSVYRINGVQIASGDLGDGGNLAKTNASNTFSATNTFSAAVTATNASNTLGGNGAALTNLNASNLASGTVVTGRISGSYTGITGTGALAAGSIATGFGTISTGNNITTTTTVQGATVNATTGVNTGGTLRLNSSGVLSSITGYTQTSGNFSLTQAAGNQMTVTSGAAIPNSDQVAITNTGSTGVVTANANGLSVSYKGGAAAVEAAGAKINLTPGTTSGGTWSGMRVTPTAGAASGVTMNGYKVDGITGGAGTENAFWVGTGWDNILSYNGASIINGSGVLQSAALSGTYSNALTMTNASNQLGGNGSALTNLNATNLASGTVNSARVSGSYTGVTGTGALAAGSIATGFGTISTGNTISTTSTVTGANVNATGNLQTGGTTRIDSAGNITGASVNVTGSVTGGIFFGVAGDFRGYVTSNTSNTNAGQWTKLASCTLGSQYNDCHTTALVTMYGDGSGTTVRAQVNWRAKQQNAFGSNPGVQLEINDVNSLTISNFMSVITSNAGPTVVELWGNIPQSYQSWAVSPLINGGSNKVTWLQTQGFSASLPAGTQTAAVYSDEIANTVTAVSYNATNSYKYNGASGAGMTCTGGQFIQNATVQGGILTGGACAAATAGVTTVGALDGQTRNGNGATIVGTTIYLQSADGSNPGLVTATGSQTFGGTKIFNGAVTMNSTLSVSGAVAGTNSLAITNTSTTGGALGVAANGSGIYAASITNNNAAGGGLSVKATSSGTQSILTLSNATGAVFDVSAAGIAGLNGEYQANGNNVGDYNGVSVYNANAGGYTNLQLLSDNQNWAVGVGGSTSTAANGMYLYNNVTGVTALFAYGNGNLETPGTVLAQGGLDSWAPAGGGGSISRTSRVVSVRNNTGTSYGSGTYTPSGTFTPTGGSVLIAHVLATESCGGTAGVQEVASDGSDLTITGGGLTWVPITGRGWLHNNNNCDDMMRVFYAVVPSTPPSNMQVTTDAGVWSVDNMTVYVDEYTGVDTSSPIDGAISGNRDSTADNQTWTATLGGTPSSNDWKIAATNMQNQNPGNYSGISGFATPSGWTQQNVTTTTPVYGASSQVISQTGSTSTTVNYALGDLRAPPNDTIYTAFILKASGSSSVLNIGTTNATDIVLGNATTAVYVPTLYNCGSIKTDANGLMTCGGNTVVINKQADETINDTQTLHSDNDFKFYIGANETWTFDISSVIRSVETEGFKFTFLAPSGYSACQYMGEIPGWGWTSYSTTCTDAGAIFISSQNGSGAYQWYEPTHFSGTIVNGSTPGYVQFRWAQNGTSTGTDITTVFANSSLRAYKVTGADVAETYYSKDMTTQPGDVVRLDNSIKAGVQKSTAPYASDVFGVVSTNPGVVIGDNTVPEGKPVKVGLVGRVPVRVTAKNGAIKAGDYLTTSDIPGVAMKATKAGAIIGTAMEDYSGTDVGTINIFLKNGSGNGMSIADMVGNNADAGSTLDLGQNTLSYLQQADQQGNALQMGSSDIITDRVAASKEVITPQLTAGTVRTDTITSSTGKGIDMKLAEGEEFSLQGNDATQSIRMDAAGNATFTGTVTADKIKANSIEGLEYIVGQAVDAANGESQVPTLNNDLQTQISSLQSAVSDLSTLVTTDSVKTVDLAVSGDANIGGDLLVAGTAKLQNLELSGHFITKGDAPTMELQAYAGVTEQPTDPHATQYQHLAKAMLTGNDTGGKLELTIGDNAQNIQPGDLIKVNFNKKFDADPQVLVNARGKDGVQMQFYVNQITDEYFTIAALGTPQAGATYTLSYYAFQ